MAEPGAISSIVEEAGRIDVLVANLATFTPRVPILETDDTTMAEMFEKMVYPLHRLVRAVLP